MGAGAAAVVGRSEQASESARTPNQLLAQFACCLASLCRRRRRPASAPKPARTGASAVCGDLPLADWSRSQPPLLLLLLLSACRRRRRRLRPNLAPPMPTAAAVCAGPNPPMLTVEPRGAGGGQLASASSFARLLARPLVLSRLAGRPTIDYRANSRAAAAPSNAPRALPAAGAARADAARARLPPGRPNRCWPA